MRKLCFVLLIVLGVSEVNSSFGPKTRITSIRMETLYQASIPKANPRRRVAQTVILRANHYLSEVLPRLRKNQGPRLRATRGLLRIASRVLVMRPTPHLGISWLTQQHYSVVRLGRGC